MKETVAEAVEVQKTTKPDVAEAKKRMRIERDKDREKVRGIFRFYEVPGGTLSFVYKKYKGEPVERFDMIDGMVYTVPLGVAKHLNKNGRYPIHAYRSDEEGKTSMFVGKKVARFAFQSLEFVDLGEENTDIEIATLT